MPAPASSVVDELRHEMLSTELLMREIYDRASGGRGRFSTSQRVRAERELAKRIESLTRSANRFYSDRLPDLFLQGAKEAAPDYGLSEDDLRLLAQIQDDGLIKIQVSNELAKRDIDRWGQVAEGSRFKAGTKKHDVRGIVTASGARLRPQQYSGLVMSADASRSYNFGLITGARAAGFKKVLVHDGTDCGLRQHDDPERANNLVLTLDTAMAHPISHPYCVRTFEPYDGDRRAKGTFKGIAKAGAKVAAAGAVAGVAGTVALRSSVTLQRRLTELLEKGSPAFASYRRRVLQVARATKESFGDVDKALAAEMDEWALNEAHALSARARQLLGVDAAATRKVVGDSYDDITDFRHLRVVGVSDLDVQNSVGGHLTSMVVGDGGGTLSWRLPRVFSNRRGLGATIAGSQGRASARIGRDLSASIGRRVGKFRFGVNMPGLDSNVIPFMNFMPHQLVRYRISKIKHGVANRIVLNPNGVLRAGFAIDPRNGYVTPSLRFLPKGPIRIFTEVNRTPGQVQQGALLKATLEKGMLVGRVQGAQIESSFRDIFRRGAPGQPGFLRSSDFRKGFVKDELRVTQLGPAFDVDNDVIRRGRIPRALSINDPDTGKRVHVDLLIRNGKFVLGHVPKAGRITSVTAEVRISVAKALRFNVRTNFNLRPLELQTLGDIRHLTLRDLQKIDPRHAWRVRSFALQLHAFDRTIWQIGKTLRLPWEDAQRLYRDARRLATLARNRELLDEMGRQMARVLGISEMSREEVLILLRSVPTKVKEFIGDIPDIVRISLDAMRRRYINDPITWVLGSMKSMGQLSRTLEIKYKRPNVIKLHPDDDPPVVGFRIPGGARTAEDMSRITYLTQREIADELNVSLEEANRIHDRAMAYFAMDVDDLASVNIVPSELRKYLGVEPKYADIDTFFTERQSLEFFRRIEGNAPAHAGATDARHFSARARLIERDLKMAAAMVEAEYPEAGPVRFRLFSGHTKGQSDLLGLWVPDASGIIQDSALRGWRTEAEARSFIDGLDKKIPEIWLSEKTISKWEIPDNIPSNIDIDEGVWSGLHTLIHELGHHAHLSGFDEEDVIYRFEGLLLQAIRDEVKDPNISYKYQTTVTQAVSISAEERIKSLDRVAKFAKSIGIEEDQFPNFLVNPTLANFTEADYSQAEDFRAMISNRLLMRGYTPKDRSDFESFVETAIVEYGSGVRYSDVLRDNEFSNIDVLEHWLERNQDYLIKNYMSEYGTSMGLEFVAEGFAQRWLRGKGKREDPFGAIIDRMITER